MEGKKLQEILRVKGITQTQVADLLGVTRQTVSAMMKNASVKSTTLERIADAFNIEISEFFGGGEISELKREVERQKQKIAQLESQLKQKDETISRLIDIIDKKI